MSTTIVSLVLLFTITIPGVRYGLWLFDSRNIFNKLHILASKKWNRNHSNQNAKCYWREIHKLPLQYSEICELYIKTPCQFCDVTLKASVSSQHLRDRFWKRTNLVCKNKSLKRKEAAVENWRKGNDAWHMELRKWNTKDFCRGRGGGDGVTLR